MATVKKQREK